ncbi:MAG TPA: D-alanyl-D-alanine carboxypeptidase/D-alanyl-D-alanine-endopeptidase [Ilumatobacteraceae bacterium]|nr:D-alanyl-D-alanine carboxypeptidase/D-alanyl-D-alanine-endopeptidase [Ilumatobacteraceae bacterium]HRB04865.1 D-alanyl-D-alanine carboxypeptidase/D-alanyl-D-alanine-endopeptidase [Ilumatobacteraceae bacterium]
MASRSPQPVLAMTIGALLGAVALGALTLYAHDRATPAPVAAPPVTVPAAQPAALATPLLSVRRSPIVLAQDRRADLLIAAAAPLATSVDGSSCLSLGLDDRELVARNSDVAVIPASNLKIVVAAVALDVLGPDHVFTTSVVGAAPVNGVVEGDVYLLGGGDPVLSEQWYTQPSGSRKRPPTHATSVEALADAMATAGVTQITGQVLGDDSRYDAERYPPGWANDVRVSFDGGAVGALVINDSRSTNDSQSDQPAAKAAQTFAGLLTTRGIAVGGSATGTAPTGLGVLASVQSAPLTELLNELLATSDNLTAEMMVKEIGVAVSQSGTREAGLQAMLDRLNTWGVATAGLVFTDGSGLSHDNRLTCTALAGVLRRGSAADGVGAALAIAGQDGSTLADSFEQDGLVGVLQGKTGTLHNPNEVKSLSGYFVTAPDEIEFVLLLNGPAATEYATAWDQLAAALLATAAGPQPETLAPLPWTVGDP